MVKSESLFEVLLGLDWPLAIFLAALPLEDLLSDFGDVVVGLALFVLAPEQGESVLDGIFGAAC